MIQHDEIFFEFEKYDSDFNEYLNKIRKPYFADINPSTIKERFTEVVEWVSKHCTHYVLYVHGDEMFFENKNEALMFKMWLS